MPFAMREIIEKTRSSPGFGIGADHIRDLIFVTRGFDGFEIGVITRKEINDCNGNIQPLVDRIVLADIEHLRSLAGAVSRGPDLANIKQGVGRSSLPD